VQAKLLLPPDAAAAQRVIAVVCPSVFNADVSRPDSMGYAEDN